MLRLLLSLTVLTIAWHVGAQNVTTTASGTATVPNGGTITSPASTSQKSQITVFSPNTDFADESSQFSFAYRGLNTSVSLSQFCVDEQLKTLSHWNTTGPTINLVSGADVVTQAVDWYELKAVEPCCSTCFLSAVHAQVLYWPTPAPTNAATAFVFEGRTFISPSVYVVYSNVSATNLCGLAGSSMPKATLTFDPTDVSSLRTIANSRLNNAGPPIRPTIPVAMDFRDLNNCSLNLDTINISLIDQTSLMTRTTVSGAIIWWEPCVPMLDIPLDAFRKIQPEWASCSRVPQDIIAGIWDPPIPLTPQAQLVVPPATSAAPLPNPTSPAPISTPMILTSASDFDPKPSAAPGLDPPKPSQGLDPPKASQDPDPSPDPPTPTLPPNLDPADPADPTDPAGAPYLSSNPSSPLITIGDITLSLRPSGVIVAPGSQALTPGGPAVTDPGTGEIISIDPSSNLIVGSRTVSISYGATSATAGNGMGGAIWSAWVGGPDGTTVLGGTETVTQTIGGNGGPLGTIIPGAAASLKPWIWIGTFVVATWISYLFTYII